MSEPSMGTAFRAGDVVADRFEILKILGAGGGGEVYEAFDRELRENIALKTIRADIAGNEEAIQRFKREVQLARKVTHPNVCRIFDLFTTTSQDTGRSISFLTMELLGGETLSAKLRQSGRLSTSEALPIVRQIVSGLTAAHEAGVIHRDLKSDNIRLTQDKDGNSKAMLMDFGLALSSTTHLSHRLTEQDSIVGTVAYMAPEQLEGRKVTAAADIYALGVVMYEIITGAQPYQSDSMVTTLTRKLTQEPPSPRIHVANLPREWEQTILRCMENFPEDRFTSADAVLKALESGKTISRPSKVRHVRRTALRWTLVILTVAALAAAFFFRSPQTGTSTGGAQKGRRSVAVLGFKNLSQLSDAAWLSTALSEMMTMELAAGGELRLVPGENVARMKIELSLPDADSLAADTLQRIRKNINTDYVVIGSYISLPKTEGTIRLDMRLQETASGDVLSTVTRTGSTSSLFDLVSGAGAEIRKSLGIGSVSQAQILHVRASLPMNAEAARYYSEGLTALRQFEFRRGQYLLEKSIAIEDSFAQAHSALAQAWSDLGYDDRSVKEARKAMDLSTGLSGEERLGIEGRYYFIQGDYPRSITAYQALFETYPDNLDYGLRLAQAYYFAAQNIEAMKVVRRLRNLPPPDSEDPRIDLQEAFILIEEGSDYAATAEKFRIAESKARERGMLMIAAEALSDKGSILLRMGELEQAAASYESAMNIYKTAGDRISICYSLLGTGRLADLQGNLEKAVQDFSESLRISEEIGNVSTTLSALSNKTLVLWKQGKLQEALSVANRALKMEETFADKSGEPILWRNKGLVLMELGELSQAKAVFEKWLEKTRPEKGRVPAMHLDALAQVFLRQGDLLQAEKFQKESLEIRNQIGEKGTAAQSQVELARIALASGQPVAAASLVREALGEFVKQKRGDDVGYCYLLLTRAALAEGNSDSAAMHFEQASALLANSQNYRLRTEFQIADGRMQMRKKNVERSLTILQEIANDTKNAEIPSLHMEAGLALGEALRMAGKLQESRIVLQEVEREARRSGHGLIERSASKLKL